MVSHPESAVAERSMSLPSPPSSQPPPYVESQRAYPQHQHRSRSRYGGARSHHGGRASSSSAAQMNEFPIFSATGDVEIVIRAADQERRYLLHRLILAQNSEFFAAGMSDEDWKGSETGKESDLTAVVTAGPASPTAKVNGKNAQYMPAIDEDAESSARRGSGRPRFRYELDWENREEDEVPILVQKPASVNNLVFTGQLSPRPPPPPPARTKPTAPQQGFFRSMANLTGIQSAVHLPSSASNPSEESAVDPTIRDYDNLLRIFYNYPPQLNSVNIATAYAECKSLLLLADMYDALPVTGPRVDHHLLGFSSKLYKQIAKYPPSYLKLGYLARSRVIFSEALIHVVGQWPFALPHIGPSSYSPVPDAVLDLIEDKVDDLEDTIARVEGKLFRLSLTTSKGERVSPSNGYLDWLAVSLFRQWLVENTTPPPPSILKPLPSQPGGSSSNPTSVPATPAARQPSNGPMSASGSSPPNTSSGGRSRQKPSSPPFSVGRTYRLLGSSNSQAYLPRDELKRFLRLQDSLYSRENLKRFERKMDEIKRLAREIVKPLMRNFLELDLRTLGGTSGDGSDGGMVLPYLTCTKVAETDFPWD